MKATVSFVLMFAAMFSTTLPVIGQRSRVLNDPSLRSERAPVKSQKGKKNATRFETVESYSEGKGVFLRWKMAYEKDNLGFYVYRSDASGVAKISDVVPGGMLISRDEPLEEQEYKYYDPTGTIGSGYYIEAISLSGSSVRSDDTIASFVNNIDGVEDGKQLRTAELGLAAESTKVGNEFVSGSELKTEIVSGLVQADPTNHRFVLTQPGVRIGVQNSGVIRITRNELAAGGFDVNTDPANWQLYLEGVQLPVILGPNADYIEFLGKTLDTVESDIRMYYLINGSGPGKRMANAAMRQGFTTLIGTKYNQTFSFVENTNFSSDVLNGDAENFWGRFVLSANRSQGGPAAPTDLVMNLTGVDKTAGTRRITLTLQGFSFTNHNVTVKLNGTQIGNITGASTQSMTKSFDVSVDLFQEGPNTLTFQEQVLDAACFFDKVNIDYPRKYIAQNNRLDFYNDDYRRATVSGFTTPDIRLFDVTYETEPRVISNAQIVQTNGTWGPVIPAGRGRAYLAVAASQVSSAFSITPNNPELVGDPARQGTLVVITQKDLINDANAWANYRSQQGIVTKVIDVQEIFDEFSYGVLSSVAIRSFLQYAKNNWATPPSYVLMIGDSSVDSKNYRGFGYRNRVPTKIVDTLFEETGSDEALADFNGDGLAEMPIGRVAANTSADVQASLTKTMQWEAAITPNVLDRGALFAYDWPDGYDFQAMSDRIMANLPASMPKVTVRSDAAGANTVVLNAFNEVDASVAANSGVYVANYAGHGNLSAWRSTSLLHKSQISSMTNSGRPTLVTALTCLNGYFVGYDPASDSLAERFTLTPNKGAVAMWASTGKTTPDVQELMAKRFFLKLNEGSILRIGDLIGDAKAALPAGADVRRSWALFGDPMLKVR